MSAAGRSDIRVGVVGMGRWGKEVIQAVAGQADLVVCSNNSDSVAHDWLRARWPDVQASFDFEAVLDRDDIDAVIIATPNPTHTDLVLMSLAAGKHVLVEKPLATSLDDLASVEEALAHAQRTLVVGYTLLHSEVAEEILRRAATDPIVEINATWLKWGSFSQPLLWNLLVHHVALCVHLMGAHAESFRWTDVIASPGVTVLDRLEAHLTGDSFRARSHIDRCAASSVHCITLRTATNELLLWEGDRLFTGVGGVLTEVFSAAEPALDREIRSFLASIEDGRVSSGIGATRVATDLLVHLEEQIGSSQRGLKT